MVSSTLALLFFCISDFQIVSRAAAPDGRCPVECRGYFVYWIWIWIWIGQNILHSTRNCPSGAAALKGQLASWN